MPEPNWQQQGSFLQPIAAPVGDPDTGTLYQLPCIAQEYIPILLGCLDQLRNPSTWDPTLTQAQLAQALARVDQLTSLFANAVSTPCCNVQMQLTSGCELQYSVDGGSTWTTVSGWDANFGGCVRADIAPPPTNPLGLSLPTYQCSVAGFLAKQIIQGSLSSLTSSYNSNLSLLSAAGDLATVLAAVGFVWVAGFVDLVATVYPLITSSTISHFMTAESDATLASDLTCCIYSNLGSDEGITPGNFTAIRNCICGVSYTYPEVITAICSMIDNWGISGLQNLQVGAALVIEDCSSCGGNQCYYWPWVTTNSFSQSYGGWASGDGYYALNCPNPTCGISCNLCNLQGNLSHAVTCTQIDLLVNNSGANGTAPTQQRQLVLSHSGTSVFTAEFPEGAYTTPTWVSITVPSVLIDEISVIWFENFSGIGAQLRGLQMHFTGTNPFTPSACIH
jgi:hypothetical protein